MASDHDVSAMTGYDDGRGRYFHGLRVSICMAVKWIAAAVIVFAVSGTAFADGIRIDRWSAADMLPWTDGMQVFRYGAVGLGAYPYRSAVPGLPVRVRLDGVPLAPVSPFGADLDMISTVMVDSLAYDGFSRMDIMGIDPVGAETATTIDFLMGARRRFNFDTSFRRSLSPNSGIFFSGSSSGMHSGDDTMKHAFRNYYLKYARRIGQDGRAFFTARGYRDRDGLADLDRLREMGERRTDGMSFSAGIEDIPVAERTTFSQTVYFSAMNSRFTRYGERQGIEDDGAGTVISLETRRGATSYGIRASYDGVFFDSSIHDDEWTRRETEASATFAHDAGRYRLKLEGGGASSSKYDGGVRARGEVIVPQGDTFTFRVAGAVGPRFPDAGSEYYTSAAFSDTSVVSKLDACEVTTGEADFTYQGGIVTTVIGVFVTRYEHPLFVPASNALDVMVNVPFSTMAVMSGTKKLYGLRASAETHFEALAGVDIMAAGTRLNTEKRGGVWPYPETDIRGELALHKTVYRGMVGLRAFASGNMLDWEDAHTSPKGMFFLLNCGLSVNVASIELRYRIDNVTGENIGWFNTLGWLERNAMWGVSWSFLD